jgi:ribosomal protein S12 methylthiotransferase accessory factor
LIFPVDHHARIFASAARQLEQPGPSDQLQPEVFCWLQSLRYIGADGRATEPSESANRAALLRLMSECRDVFFLHSALAPCGIFLGSVPDIRGCTGSTVPVGGASGRGADLRQAFESCAGEAAESLSILEWTGDRMRTGFDRSMALGSEHRRWSLDGIGLAATGQPDAIDWIAAEPLTGGKQVRFPFELVIRCEEERAAGTRPADSTGLAAGRTRDDALRAGLLETIERDAVALWWWGGNTARRVDPQILEADALQQFLSRIRQGAARKTWFLDLTRDIDVPVIAALSSNDDGTSAVAGFAADTNIEKAIRGAFLELCQMELAQAFSMAKLDRLGAARLQDQDRLWIERHDRLHCEDYPVLTVANPHNAPSLPDAGGTGTVLDRLRRAGLDAWYVDLTRREIGVPVVKVLVPGLQTADPGWISERLVGAARRNNRPIDPPVDRLAPI